MKKPTFFSIAIFCFQLSFAQENFPYKTELTTLKDFSIKGTDANENTPFYKQMSTPRNGNNSPEAGTGSPYKTTLLKDGLVITGAVGLNLLGYQLVENKHNLTPAELATKTKDKLPFFDRFCAGLYSDKANKDSYILFDAAYAFPFIAGLIDKNERAKFGQVAVLYIETIAITGSMYTLAAGLVYRSRPFVYGDKAPLDKRLDKGGQRSFYGGHVAATAASTFFVAKVFQDFNPGSKLTPYLYVASGALTTLMAYFRIRAGYHFFSDCTLSAIIGTATGILIPQLHKNKSLKDVSLTPELFGNGANGFALTYRF